MKIVSMTIQGRYFNPSRASPLDVIVKDGYRGKRVYIDKQPAVAICTGYCTDSKLIRGKTTKSISVLFHGQEWERYCCFLNMIFDQKNMIAQLFKSALTFSSLPESVSAPPKFANTPISPLASRRMKVNDTPADRGRGVLFFSDIGRFKIYSTIKP
jgi:hypothetical protein